jgi:hypothetical protein
MEGPCVQEQAWAEMVGVSPTDISQTPTPVTAIATTAARTTAESNLAAFTGKKSTTAQTRTKRRADDRGVRDEIRPQSTGAKGKTSSSLASPFFRT